MLSFEVIGVETLININQTYYCYPSIDSIFRLRKVILLALVGVEELDSKEKAPLRSALHRSGGKDEYPRMLLVLGSWSLDLFELWIYRPNGT